jgi:DNA-binding LacI/PurR family transcriptional regulator
MNRPPQARLVDVARAAEVSLGTASNVFAHPERVRAEVRARVEAAARALGYAGPDPKGRLLRGGKFNAIGLVPPAELGVADAIRNPVWRQFLLGASEVCDEMGANVVLLSDRAHGRSVRDALVDGFILGRVEHLTEIEPARERRLPFVVADFDAGPEVSSVRVDARAAAREAARHLVGLGHRRFAIMSFLRGFLPSRYFPPGAPRPPEAAGMPIDREKLLGYADALGEAGIGIERVPMLQASPDDPQAADRLLDLAPEATAVLSMSVMQGLAVMAAAGRRGLAVPGRLSVVAFNDIPEAAAAGLSTVDALTCEKGRVAARLVFAGGPPRRAVLAAPLILRASTAPPPA